LLYSFLTSALDGDEWSATGPSHFTPEVKAAGTHRIGGAGGPLSRCGRGGEARCVEFNEQHSTASWSDVKGGRTEYNTAAEVTSTGHISERPSIRCYWNVSTGIQRKLQMKNTSIRTWCFDYLTTLLALQRLQSTENSLSRRVLTSAMSPGQLLPVFFWRESNFVTNEFFELLFNVGWRNWEKSWQNFSKGLLKRETIPKRIMY